MVRQPARASSGRYVSRLTGGTLAIIMAGGRGERLRDMTAHRCKPATPFGGKFRIIDFVLSCRGAARSEEHTSELQSQSNLVCRLLLEKKKKDAAHEPTMYLADA